MWTPSCHVGPSHWLFPTNPTVTDDNHSFPESDDTLAHVVPTYVAGPAPQRGHVDLVSFTRVQTRFTSATCLHILCGTHSSNFLYFKLKKVREPMKSNLRFSYFWSCVNHKKPTRRHGGDALPALELGSGEHALGREEEWSEGVFWGRILLVVFPNSTTEPRKVSL
ncbi:unnamed protein product [Sphenostylis stenocarpa]|uniref:Uncharacterized protein n=1 Tax=Sphenostylis stenocarpa TaxID=92480 RepID=A0AA86S5R6_9FABA|nr:unnamed protein product [Sphenostylis stenocarpa]